MTAVVQGRNFSFRTRMDRLQKNYLPSMPDFDAVHWAQFLLTLERLDDLWGVELNRLVDFSERPSSRLPEIPFEQLTVYLLYRHLPLALEDGDTAGHVAYVLLITELIYSLAGTHKSLSMETLVEIVRMYSAEIEYSDRNMDAVISELHALGI